MAGRRARMGLAVAAGVALAVFVLRPVPPATTTALGPPSPPPPRPEDPRWQPRHMHEEEPEDDEIEKAVVEEQIIYDEEQPGAAGSDRSQGSDGNRVPQQQQEQGIREDAELWLVAPVSSGGAWLFAALSRALQAECGRAAGCTVVSQGPTRVAVSGLGGRRVAVDMSRRFDVLHGGGSGPVHRGWSNATAINVQEIEGRACASRTNRSLCEGECFPDDWAQALARAEAACAKAGGQPGLPCEHDGRRLVLLLRDPRAAAVDYMYEHGLGTERGLRHAAVARFSYFVWRAALLFEWYVNRVGRLRPVLPVFYEDVASDLPAQVGRILRFAGLTLSAETAATLLADAAVAPRPPRPERAFGRALAVEHQRIFNGSMVTHLPAPLLERYLPGPVAEAVRKTMIHAIPQPTAPTITPTTGRLRDNGLEFHFVSLPESGPAMIELMSTELMRQACASDPNYAFHCIYTPLASQHRYKFRLKTYSGFQDLWAYHPGRHDLKTGNKEAPLTRDWAAAPRPTPEEQEALACAQRQSVPVTAEACMPPAWTAKRQELKQRCPARGQPGFCTEAKSAFVVVLRDPRDLVVSWARTLQLGSPNTPLSLATIQPLTFVVARLALWYQWYKAWMEDFHAVAVVFYEDMCSTPAMVVRNLATEFGLKVSDATISSVVQALAQPDNLPAADNEAMAATPPGAYQTRLSADAKDMLETLMRTHLPPELQRRFRLA